MEVVQELQGASAGGGITAHGLYGGKSCRSAGTASRRVGRRSKVGRVYRINSISTGGWFWVCYAFVGNRSVASFGQVATRDEACNLVEQAYDELKARVGASDQKSG